MADYVSLKVPELKKLLQEKQLPVTGNKADLIARLQEHDKPKEEPKPATAAAPGSFSPTRSTPYTSSIHALSPAAHRHADASTIAITIPHLFTQIPIKTPVELA